MKHQYKFSFQIESIILFLLMMLPNFIWFAIPAPDDVLRSESITPRIDMIASVFQVIMIAGLCVIKNKAANKIGISKWTKAGSLCCLLYYCSWICYYQGLTNTMVILGLTVPPRLTFLFYAIDRKNIVAIISSVVIMVCHFIYGVVNFIH